MLFKDPVCILGDKWIVAMFALEESDCYDRRYRRPEEKILDVG
jgi:hypothetical protein